MRYCIRAAAAIIALTAFVGTTPEGVRASALGPQLDHRASGDLIDVAEGVGSGSFDLRAWVRDNGNERSKIVIRVTGLDATQDDDGERPPYGAFVIDAANAEVFVGRVRVNRLGNGSLRVNGARGLFEGAGLPLRGFGGGTVEVRRGDIAILRGSIATFALQNAGTSASRSETYGTFIPFSAPDHRPGRYQLRTDEFETGEIRNRIVVKASGVLTGQSPPTYSVRVINAAGNRVVTLGNMTNHPEIGASFTLDSRSRTVPGSIVRWSEFDNGLIEVRRGGTLMLRGDIAPIRRADRPVGRVGNARWRETVELSAPMGAARGLLTVSAKTSPRRRTQEIRMRIEDVDPDAGPYTAAVVVGGATRTELATFKVRGQAATGGFRVTTRRGDPIPDRFVFDAAGGLVEVTDANGTVVLTTTFPSLD